jgi:hypothetical protein
MNMIASPFRFKRSRDAEEEASKEDNIDTFSFKRMCTESPATGDVHCTPDTFPLCATSSQPNTTCQEKNDNNDEENDMEVNDLIVDNFNTISFDTPSHGDNNSNSSYPVFPPLRRVGRKIDHLVDEVMRKSCRINPEMLQISIPPSEFEFQMPPYVSAAGSPTRDARLISSPGTKSLTLAAIRQSTTPCANRCEVDLSEPKRIQYSSSAPHFLDNHYGESHSDESSHLHYHLGNVTHSDWFACKGALAGDNKKSFRNNSRNTFQQFNNTINESDDDDDYEDMYIES